MSIKPEDVHGEIEKLTNVLIANKVPDFSVSFYGRGGAGRVWIEVELDFDPGNACEVSEYLIEEMIPDWKEYSGSAGKVTYSWDGTIVLDAQRRLHKDHVEKKVNREFFKEVAELSSHPHHP